MYNNGYKIVFFTNQAGVSTGKTNIKCLKEKIEDIIKQLDVPIQAFIAPTRTIYRKPAPGMWDALLNQVNITLRESITFFSFSFKSLNSHYNYISLRIDSCI